MPTTPMTDRGRVHNGVIVLDTPAALPEGAAVEVTVVTTPVQRPPITSIDELRRELPGDPFGPDFDVTLRQWRNEPWRLTPQEPLE